MNTPHTGRSRTREGAGPRFRFAAIVTLLVLAAAACNGADEAVPAPVAQLPGHDPSIPVSFEIIPDTACVTLVGRAKQPNAADSIIQRAQACAFKQDSLRRDRTALIAAGELARQGRLFMDIPEFHDEQRLAGDQPRRLGPYAGIFTAPFAGRFKFDWQYDEHQPAGILIAYVIVLQETGETLPASYTNLNLQFGMNCIFVGRETPIAPLRAWVTQPTATRSCRDHAGITATLPGTALRVRVRNYPAGNMVAASRFEEDSQGRAIFGVPCGRQWCRIGLPDFAEAPTSFCSWGGTACDRKEERIPSWYDEQQWDKLEGGQWVAMDLRAAIVPRTNIDANSSVSFNVPRYVADLYFREMPPTDSWMYQKGMRRGKNKVELRTFVDPGGVRRWQYTITPVPNPTGVIPTPMDVVGGPHRHWDAPLPGTTRFRYTMLDPGVWAPCGQACCPSGGF